MRSILTTLGIVIGVARGHRRWSRSARARQAKIRTSIARLGTNLLIIFPGRRRGGPRRGPVVTMTDDDGQTIARRRAAAVAPLTPVSARAQIKYLDRNHAPAHVVGVNENWPDVPNFDGRPRALLRRRRSRGRRQVCVLGSTVARGAVRRQEPVGPRSARRQLPVPRSSACWRKGPERWARTTTTWSSCPSTRLLSLFGRQRRRQVASPLAAPRAPGVEQAKDQIDPPPAPAPPHRGPARPTTSRSRPGRDRSRPLNSDPRQRHRAARRRRRHVACWWAASAS